MKSYIAIMKLQRMVRDYSGDKRQKKIIERYAKLMRLNFKFSHAEKLQYNKIKDEFWGEHMGII